MPELAEHVLMLARSHVSQTSRVTDAVVKSALSVTEKMRKDGSRQTHLSQRIGPAQAVGIAF